MKERYVLTAADFADTGQWRLLVNIYQGGLDAFLENTLHREIDPQELCRAEWAPDKEKLSKNIEEAVYNNPRLLDDFATRIVLYDRCTMLIPKEIAEESAGSEEELYKRVYKAESTDIMTDFEGDITGVWSMGPGVKSFLSRTFPGARITCNLLEQVRHAFGISAGKEERGRKKEERENGYGKTGLHVYKTEREDEVDLVLIDGNDLLSASTHEIKNQKDIERLEQELFKAYGKDRI